MSLQNKVYQKSLPKSKNSCWSVIKETKSWLQIFKHLDHIHSHRYLHIRIKYYAVWTLQQLTANPKWKPVLSGFGACFIEREYNEVNGWWLLILKMLFKNCTLSFSIYRYKHIYRLRSCFSRRLGLPDVPSNWQLPPMALVLLFHHLNFLSCLACEGTVKMVMAYLLRIQAMLDRTLSPSPL